MQQWHIDCFFLSGLMRFTFFPLEKKEGGTNSTQAALHLCENKQKKTTIMQLSNNKSMCLLSWKCYVG